MPFALLNKHDKSFKEIEIKVEKRQVRQIKPGNYRMKEIRPAEINTNGRVKEETIQVA